MTTAPVACNKWCATANLFRNRGPMFPHPYHPVPRSRGDTLNCRNSSSVFCDKKRRRIRPYAGCSKDTYESAGFSKDAFDHRSLLDRNSLCRKASNTHRNVICSTGLVSSLLVRARGSASRAPRCTKKNMSGRSAARFRKAFETSASLRGHNRTLARQSARSAREDLRCQSCTIPTTLNTSFKSLSAQHC